MKKKISIATIIVLFINIILAVLTALTENSICLSLTIASGTFLFHMVLRLLVGYLVPFSFKYTQKYFDEKSFEKKLYKFLKVKKWKKYLPSYNPASYSTESRSLEDIANTMCRNEVIHSLDVILSVIPLFFAIPFGSFFVFLITSIIAGLIDSLFVIMQRFNRPRIVRLINRSKK